MQLLMVIIIIIGIIITIIIIIIERRSRASLLKGDQRTDFRCLPPNAQAKAKSIHKIWSGPFFLPPFQFVYPVAARSKA
jgi:uncharacterized membrane protein YqiK